jgi:hypothetical protein
VSKKDLANVTTDLSALASMMPTQRPASSPAMPAVSAELPVLKDIASSPANAVEQGEEVTQFSLSLRKGLRKELARLAADADMTMRAFVLNALKEKGLAVRDDDLLDLRRERR